mgnify:FL=1
MQVYKTFLRIFKKQIGSCMIYFCIFLGLMIGFSKMGGKGTDKYETYSCKLAIFDRDNSEASRMLTDYLSQIHEMVDVPDDEKVIQNNLYFWELDYVLYIENGYENSGRLTNIKRPGSNTGMYVDNQIASYESSMSALMDAGYDMDSAYDITLEAMSDEGLVKVYGNSVEKKPEYYYFFLYLPYVIIMMLFNGLGAVLIAFNRQNVSDRVNVSPVPIRKRNIQLAAGVATLGVGTWLLFMILGYIMYGAVLINAKTIYLILNSLVFTLISVGIVNIVGSFNLSTQNIAMIANIVGLGFSFLGGVFVPMSIFSEGLKKVSMIIPTYWYVMANDGIMLDENIGNIMQYIGIEVLFAAAFMVISMLISKRKKLARAE